MDPEIELGELEGEAVSELLALLAELGVSLGATEWSPDFQWTPCMLGGAAFGLVHETYIGFSLKGPLDLIEHVAAEWRKSRGESSQ